MATDQVIMVTAPRGSNPSASHQTCVEVMMPDHYTSVEEWRAIPSNPRYEASSHGRVRRVTPASGTQPGRILRPSPNTMGYLTLTICSPGSRKTQLVHRLVMEAFLGSCPEGMVSRHLNGDCTDNRIENLRYGTMSENRFDSVRHGTMPCGEDHHKSKLTEDQVREIRARYAKGDIGQRPLAREYGITKSSLQSVVLRRSWRHVP